MQDELDNNLKSLFQEKSKSLPEEPFLGNMLDIIERRQSRRVLVQKLISVLGFCCCVLFSRVLIKGSVLLSGGLNIILETIGNFMNTPVVMASAALCALLLLIFNRRLISRFI